MILSTLAKTKDDYPGSLDYSKHFIFPLLAGNLWQSPETPTAKMDIIGAQVGPTPATETYSPCRHPWINLVLIR